MNTQTLEQHLKYKIPQIKLAILREPTSEPMPAIQTPIDLEQYLEPMKHLSEEHFVSLHLTPRMQVMGYHVVSQGTVSASLAHPREVFKAAVLNNAYCVVVAHNHPGGTNDPSPDDLNVTKQLIAAGRILGIEILDHLIVSYRSITSIREWHPHLFQEDHK